MTRFEITAVQRAGWQRRAAAELVRILETHRDLPLIAWRVASAGATLVGHVHGLAEAVEIRKMFEVWRAALTLGQHTETSAGPGTVYLRATADRDRVRVTLVATLLAEEPEAVQR